jgi:hypothetical protein
VLSPYPIFDVVEPASARTAMLFAYVIDLITESVGRSVGNTFHVTKSEEKKILSLPDLCAVYTK